MFEKQPYEDERVSHSYCEICLEKALKEMEEEDVGRLYYPCPT
jgi:hypothetical protein